VTIIPLADCMTKYPLALAGGDDIDLIFCAPWLFFSEQADRGAYRTLTKEFLNKWMPQTMKTQVPASWRQGEYKGKVYVVPRNYSDYENTYGVIVRKDLREKYKIPKIKSIDDFVKYLRAVAANEKGTGLFALYNFPSLPVEQSIFRSAAGIMSIENDMVWNSMEHKTLDANDVFYVYTSEYFRKYALLAADLAKAGVWPSNAITGTTHTADLFREGKSGSDVAMYKSANTQILEMAKRGIEVEYFNVIPKGTPTRISPYYYDSIAITSFSRNPERAALALDVMKNDKEVNRLLVGGIEGVHYLYDAKANTYTQGPKSADYAWSGWAWSLRSHLTPNVGGITDSVRTVRAEFDATNIDPKRFPVDGFAFDNSKVASETAVISSIVKQYQYSFDLGVFGDNTQAKLDQFAAELKRAGIDKVTVEFKRQLQAFLASR
jgi:hypothetical protein